MIEAVVREGKRRLLSLIHNIEYIVNRRRVESEIKNYNFDVIENSKPAVIKTVCFIITRFVRFHGGQTSVLRLGTQLEKLGFNVIYAVYKKQSEEEMKLCAASNLADYKGKVMSFSRFLKHEAKGHTNMAAVVATSWDTVAFAKRCTGYRMYFVQDYEPYFYSFGELFLMAQKTYEQGLHMVSLGSWNKEIIEKNCRPVSPLDVISFPYEQSEYRSKERDFAAYKGKRSFKMAVYLKYYGKRLPNIIPAMLEKTIAGMRRKGITLEVMYFGEALSFTPRGGKNLGMLSKEELANLYAKADFGMVASMSNISLVPYEMLSAGLPLIEIKEGTFPYFFPDNSALLVSMADMDFSDKLLECIRKPELLAERNANAYEYMKNLSWERTGKEFAEILRSE